jgi:hypothetical protein
MAASLMFCLWCRLLPECRNMLQGRGFWWLVFHYSYLCSVCFDHHVNFFPCLARVSQKYLETAMPISYLAQNEEKSPDSFEWKSEKSEESF